MALTDNMVGTMRALVNDASLLVRQEVQLAKAEASEKVEEATTGLVAIVAAAIIALTALMVLVQALVVALANFMPPSVAALLVGVVLAIIAYVTLTTGTSKLSAQNLKPTRTINSVRESAETIQEAV